MSQSNNEQEKLENDDTLFQDNSSFEVKESLFDKIKSALTRPRLGPGNNVKTTNMSFDSWSFRATFRRALEAVSNGMSNIMRKKEPEIKNGFNTVVIGDTSKTSSKDLETSKEDIKQPNVVIPGKIPGLQAKAKEPQAQNHDLLVGTVATKESPTDKPVETLKVEKIDISEQDLLLEQDEKDAKKDKKEEQLKPEVINIGTQTKENEINKDNDQELSI